MYSELHAERTNFGDGFLFPKFEREFTNVRSISQFRAFHSRRGPFSFEVRAGPRRLRSFEFGVHEIRANSKKAVQV